MRIHRLTFQAVGPFPGRHQIDFDALSAGGLFLLEGPTGAGKSTIIDAVVFALYGKVAGAEASDDRLHSDHADPDVEPFVELTFSTAAGIHRVWRSPTYQRPKRRGGGYTTQNARAKLWRLASAEDETGEAVSAHVQEVGGEVARLVVLDRAQFTQTVVLPQGQFASFLRARPEDRRALLQEVFGTEVYERVQRRLVEMARAAQAELGEAEAEVRSAAEALGEAAAGLGDPAAADDRAHPGGGDQAHAGDDAAHRLRGAGAELDLAALTESADRLRHQAAAAATRAAAQAATTQRAEATALQRLTEHRDLAVRLARREGLLAEADRLRRAEPALARLAERLDRARRAATVAPARRAHDRAVRRLEAAEGLEARLRDRLRGGPDEDLAAPLTAAELRRVCDAAHAEHGSLTELLALEAALPARSAQLAETSDQVAELARQLATVEEALARRPLTRRVLEDERGALRGAGIERAEAAARAATATRMLAAAAEAATCRGRLAEADGAVLDAARVAGAATDAEHEIRRRWVAGMAGALAARLTPGAACPVCGAVEHPAPARPSPDHPTDGEVEAVTAAREAADAALTAARARQAEVAARLAAAAAVAEDLTPEEARARVTAAERAVAAADAQIHRGAELEQALVDHDAETETLAAEQTSLRAAHATATERLAAATDRLAEDRRRCVAAQGAAVSIAARAGLLTARAQAAQDLAGATEEVAQARRALAEAVTEVAAALSAAGLPDAAAADAAALPDAEQDALASQLQDHRSAQDRVTAGLGEPGIAELTGTEDADVEAAAAAHDAARAAHADALTRTAQAQMRAQRCAAAAQRLGAALAVHDERARGARPVIRTAALAAGGEGNQLDTSLATYVLLARFEDVVAAANDRLTVMSGGRYALERIDEHEGGQRSRRAGLGLQVRDHLTEAPRDPRTLSGGETFYVSLCLALGLADVVRAEAGGVELGTLFIDEGFGSLDPATLEVVMTELGRLHDGGRAVGVVSHVADLKDRIAERVEVRRLPSGASTLAVRC